MDRLKNDTVIRTVRDVESFLFANRLDLQRFQHNKSLGNTTQSQQYIMDIIDQKFEKLKDQIYKLGISPVQFRNMVEGQALIEWSPEIGLSLSQRFCSWVVPEMDAEHLEESILELLPKYVAKQRSSEGSIKVIIETEENIVKGQDLLRSSKKRTSSASDLFKNNSLKSRSGEDDSEQGSERTDPNEKKITDEAEISPRIKQDQQDVRVEFD